MEKLHSMEKLHRNLTGHIPRPEPKEEMRKILPASL